MGRKISYGFVLEVRLQFLEDLTLRVSDVSHCVWFREEFLERGFGVWSLGWCCHCEVLKPMFMVFVDICLEKEVIFGGEAGAWCLSSGSSQGEGVGHWSWWCLLAECSG